MSRRPLEACLQNPTDVYPSIPEINSSGSLGKNRATHQSDRRKGRGTGERRDLRGLSQFVVQSLLSTSEGTRPSVCKSRAKPRPSRAQATQSLPSQDWCHIVHLPQKLLFDYLAVSQKGLCFHTDTIGKPSRISG